MQRPLRSWRDECAATGTALWNTRELVNCEVRACKALHPFSSAGRWVCALHTARHATILTHSRGLREACDLGWLMIHRVQLRRCRAKPAGGKDVTT